MSAAELPSLSEPELDLQGEVRTACVAAKAASRELACAPFAKRRAVVNEVARRLLHEADALAAINAEDVAFARAAGTSVAMLDRLRLDRPRIEALAAATQEVANAPDVVGAVVTETIRPNGLRVARVRVSLGVVGLIYEARPNVTIDAAALALHSGNAIVLRGGSEALRTNRALAALVRGALSACDLPVAAVTLLAYTSRESVRALVTQVGLVDLAIPRGGEALIAYVTEHARVPVVQHFRGVCHLFIDAGADVGQAIALAVDGKLARPSVCNAIECILIDRSDAARVLPPLAAALVAGGCEIRACAPAREICPTLHSSTPADYGAEFLAPIVAIKLVDGLDGALAHIAEYGSEHTEAILTPLAKHAARFTREVEVACVVVNASTRFHDGGALGIGAELGIATSRLHWRGPMGTEALTTMKWIVRGDGQVRG
jgi:glutamate-5-semialdehyde dehydrogenase